MGAERWDEQVGSVADEAGRLLESLRRSAAEAADAAGAAPRSAADARPASGLDVDDKHDKHDGPDGPGEHDHDPLTRGAAPHDPVCQWCPICRGAAVVRSLSPETLTRLADLASVAASVLAELASARASAGPSTADAPTPPRRPQPAASRPIPVRDAGDAPEAPRG